MQEYHQLVAKGIIRAEERVELLNGQIISMAPIGSDHRNLVDLLMEFFVLESKGRYRVSAQQPIRLSGRDEPVPDLVLCRRSFQGDHPAPADVFLVIEVADSSLSFDAGSKLRQYEKAGILEYWIFAVPGSAVRIYRRNSANQAFQLEIVSRGELTPTAFPDVTLDWPGVRHHQ